MSCLALEADFDKTRSRIPTNNPLAKQKVL